MKTEQIPVAKIIADGQAQPRATINQAAVDDYSYCMKDGQKFPAITVFYDGTHYYLAHGFHRYYAAIAAEVKTILAEVKKGGLRDAILHSCSANSDQQGLRRTNEDKRRAVMTVLADKEWGARSDNWIAEMCAVTSMFVAKTRKASRINGLSSPEKRIGRDGRETRPAGGRKRKEVEDSCEPEEVQEEEREESLSPEEEQPVNWAAEFERIQGKGRLLHKHFVTLKENLDEFVASVSYFRGNAKREEDSEKLFSISLDIVHVADTIRQMFMDR